MISFEIYNQIKIQILFKFSWIDDKERVQGSTTFPFSDRLFNFQFDRFCFHRILICLKKYRGGGGLKLARVSHPSLQCGLSETPPQWSRLFSLPHCCYTTASCCFCERMIACNWRGNVKRSTSHHARYKMIQRPHFPRYLDKYNLSRGKYGGSSTEASGKYGFRARHPPECHQAVKIVSFQTSSDKYGKDKYKYGKYGMPPPLCRSWEKSSFKSFGWCLSFVNYKLSSQFTPCASEKEFKAWLRSHCEPHSAYDR